MSKGHSLRRLLVGLFALSVVDACSGRSSQRDAMAGAGGEIGSGGASAGEVGGGGNFDSGGNFSTAEAGAGGVSGQMAVVDGGVDAPTVDAGGLDGGRAVNTGNKVTVDDGQARGAMTGHGWVRFGPFETVRSPTCQGVPLSSSVPCTSYQWYGLELLCAYGTLPAYQASDPTRAWGLMVALYATEPPGEGLGQSFQSITVAFAALPTRGTQLHVHRKGDPTDVVYWAYITSPGTMSASVTVAFNALSKSPRSSDPSLALPPEDVPNLDWIGVFMPPGTAEPDATLCLRSIEFQ